MDYAIVLYMDEAATKKMNEITNEVAKACGNTYLVGMKNVPHITISAIVGEDEKKILEETEALAGVIKQGPVKVASIGSFCPYVLYLAPVLDEYLQTACKQANEVMLKIAEVGNKGNYVPHNWVPHIAIGTRLSVEQLRAAFCKTTEMFQPILATAEKIALIKWEEHDPYQELAVFDLKK